MDKALPLNEETINQSLALLDLAEQVTHQIAHVRRLFVTEPSQLDNPELQLLYQRLNITLAALNKQLIGCGLYSMPVEMKRITPAILLNQDDDIGAKLHEIKPSFSIQHPFEEDSEDEMGSDNNNNNINDNSTTMMTNHTSPTSTAPMTKKSLGTKRSQQQQQHQKPQMEYTSRELLEAVPSVTQEYIDATYYLPTNNTEKNLIKGMTRIALSLPLQHIDIPASILATWDNNTIKTAVEMKDSIEDEGELEESIRQEIKSIVRNPNQGLHNPIITPDTHDIPFKTTMDDTDSTEVTSTTVDNNNNNNNNTMGDGEVDHNNDTNKQGKHTITDTLISPFTYLELALQMDKENPSPDGSLVHTDAFLKNRIALVKEVKIDTKQ